MSITVTVDKLCVFSSYSTKWI